MALWPSPTLGAGSSSCHRDQATLHGLQSGPQTPSPYENSNVEDQITASRSLIPWSLLHTQSSASTCTPCGTRLAIPPACLPSAARTLAEYAVCGLVLSEQYAG